MKILILSLESDLALAALACHAHRTPLRGFCHERGALVAEVEQATVPHRRSDGGESPGEPDFPGRMCVA